MKEQDNISLANKRIAVNTVMMFLRQIIIMIITFFSTRELFRILGEDEFGTLNLIAGTVAMFSFLSSTISTATSRFFNIELGKKNLIKLRQIFSINIFLYLFISLILFLLFETFGLWIFNEKIEISVHLRESATYLFHLAVIVFIINIITIPYVAMVISRENMKFIAIENVLTAILKLAIIYMLFLNEDRLTLYGVLLVLISLVQFVVYFSYCWVKYKETKLTLYWNFKDVKEFVSFSSWNGFGAIVGFVNGTLLALLLNNFFGVALNATLGIVRQVNSGVASFTQNFLVTTRPQIVEYWGAGNRPQSIKLSMQVSKIGFFLVFMISLPVIVKSEFILRVWLNEIPPYCVIFLNIMLVQLVIDVLSYPLTTLAQASGKMALYHTVVGGTLLFKMPISYMLFSMGLPPHATAVVGLVFGVVCLIERMFILRKIAGFQINTYIKTTLLPAFNASMLTLLIVLMVNYFSFWDENISFIIVFLLSVILTIAFAFKLGLTKEESGFIKDFIFSKAEGFRRYKLN